MPTYQGRIVDALPRSPGDRFDHRGRRDVGSHHRRFRLETRYGRRPRRHGRGGSSARGDPQRQHRVPTTLLFAATYPSGRARSSSCAASLGTGLRTIRGAWTLEAATLGWWRPYQLLYLGVSPRRRRAARRDQLAVQRATTAEYFPAGGSEPRARSRDARPDRPREVDVRRSSGGQVRVPTPARPPCR
jgi:hypothetical protein